MPILIHNCYLKYTEEKEKMSGVYFILFLLMKGTDEKAKKIISNKWTAVVVIVFVLLGVKKIRSGSIQ